MFEDRRYSYAEAEALSNRYARGLQALGIGRGDHVATLINNCPEQIWLYFAICKLGAVVVPLNWRLTASELTFILKDCGARTLVFGSAFAEVCEAIKGAGSDTDLLDFVELGSTAAWATPYAKVVDYSRTAEPQTAPGNDEPLTIVLSFEPRGTRSWQEWVLSSSGK